MMRVLAAIAFAALSSTANAATIDAVFSDFDANASFWSYLSMAPVSEIGVSISYEDAPYIITVSTSYDLVTTGRYLLTGYTIDIGSISFSRDFSASPILANGNVQVVDVISKTGGTRRDEVGAYVNTGGGIYSDALISTSLASFNFNFHNDDITSISGLAVPDAATLNAFANDVGFIKLLSTAGNPTSLRAKTVTILSDTVTAVPLPASFGLLGLALAGLGAMRAKRPAKTA